MSSRAALKPACKVPPPDGQLVGPTLGRKVPPMREQPGQRAKGRTDPVVVKLPPSATPLPPVVDWASYAAEQHAALASLAVARRIERDDSEARHASLVADAMTVGAKREV